MEAGKHSLDEIKEEIIKRDKLGLHTINRSFEEDITETIAKIIYGSIRSGKRIEYEGTIIVIGDVNAGAELIAEENIIIFGRLRGLAHAGAKGNKKAIVVANDIKAAQIRIADIIKEVVPKDIEIEEEDINIYYPDTKMKAYVKENEIILE